MSLRRVREAAACLGLVTVAALAGFALTPRLEVAGGLGYDGVQYAQMVVDLRDGVREPVSSLAAFRLLVPALVARSGLEVQAGFLAVDLAAVAIAALALHALLRSAGASLQAALLGVGWWLALPFGLRAFLNDPVLLEAPGIAMALLLTLAARTRRTLAFALLLPVALLVRENLIGFVPLLWLALRRSGEQRPTAMTVLATLPGLLAIVAVRAAAPIPADPVISLPGAALLNSFVVLLNVDEHAWRMLLAALATFGALPALLLARPVRAWARVGAEPEWAVLAAVAVVTAIVGGADHDRYLAPLAIPLLVLGFAGEPLLPRGRTARLGLTVLHVALAVLLFPAAADATGYAARAFSSMPAERLGPVAAWASLGMLVAFVVTRAAAARGRE